MEFASRLENIVLADKLLLDLKKEYAISDAQYSEMLTCVNEAITNAILHGNRNDPSRKVSLHAKRSPSGAFIFTVCDEGTGFSWRDSLDPLSIRSLDKPGGRGIFIMKTLASQLIFNEKGNKIELHFIT